ncbi:carbon storage regulator CsrA [Campylobacter concisus]|uniref:carbon storage regulator CsrA n=1 Tax=Campylobacter concisus TaxID=199 RepID=UPI000B3D5235|nr:carbon storage regulator CsrA [Campylobacter concisus]OUT15158.1 carbon storage regulator [Campylobacter concisus]
MLILARKENEEILIGNDIKVVIVNISKNTVKLGIEAPRNTMILRSELANDIKNENIHATKTASEADIYELAKKIEK